MFLFVILMLFKPGAAQENPGELASPAAQSHGRFLIFTGSIDLEVMALHAVQVDILRMVGEKGGYLEKIDPVEKEGVTLWVRIPSPAFTKFLEDLAQAGTVRALSQSEEDVSDQLFESRRHSFDSQTKSDPERLRLAIEADEFKIKKLKQRVEMASLEIKLLPKWPMAGKDR
ncbi:MAG: DUF4349 domain-containing protein [Acidobacteria bacterium]|nr:DUF4349 domain-containing protein [Acidobacteriota bacterium]